MTNKPEELGFYSCYAEQIEMDRQEGKPRVST